MKKALAFYFLWQSSLCIASSETFLNGDLPIRGLEKRLEWTDFFNYWKKKITLDSQEFSLNAICNGGYLVHEPQAKKSLQPLELKPGVVSYKAWIERPTKINVTRSEVEFGSYLAPPVQQALEVSEIESHEYVLPRGGIGKSLNMTLPHLTVENIGTMCEELMVQRCSDPSKVVDVTGVNLDQVDIGTQCTHTQKIERRSLLVFTEDWQKDIR